MKKNVTEILDDDFKKCIVKLQEIKAQEEELQALKKEVEEYIIAHYAPDNLETDYEGTENLLDEDGIGIRLVYKLSRKVNEERMQEVCSRMNLEPAKLFSVKYGYSATKFNLLNDDCKKAVLSTLDTKRAKTSVEVIEKK